MEPTRSQILTHSGLNHFEDIEYPLIQDAFFAIELKPCTRCKQICDEKSDCIEKEHSEAMNVWQDFREWLKVQCILDRR